MRKFVLVTESGSDIPKKYIEKYDIKVVTMHVNFQDKTCDDLEIKAQDVFDYYDKNKILPKTSGSTPHDFKKMFEEINKNYLGTEIIYIAYSAVTTVSFNSAKIAAEKYSNIHMIDSKNVSVGLSTVVIAAAEFIENNPNATAEEVVKYVEDVRERTRFVFLPQTLLYLKAGGRISNVAYLGATILKIYPTIDLINGYLIAGKKYRGSFKKAYTDMINNFFERFDINKNVIRLIRSNGLSLEHQKEVENLVKSHGAEYIEWFDANAVISCHGGPGAVGVVGIEKKK